MKKTRIPARSYPIRRTTRGKPKLTSEEINVINRMTAVTNSVYRASDGFWSPRWINATMPHMIAEILEEAYQQGREDARNEIRRAIGVRG